MKIFENGINNYVKRIFIKKGQVIMQSNYFSDKATSVTIYNGTNQSSFNCPLATLNSNVPASTSTGYLKIFSTFRLDGTGQGSFTNAMEITATGWGSSPATSSGTITDCNISADLVFDQIMAIDLSIGTRFYRLFTFYKNNGIFDSQSLKFTLKVVVTENEDPTTRRVSLILGSESSSTYIETYSGVPNHEFIMYQDPVSSSEALEVAKAAEQNARYSVSIANGALETAETANETAEEALETVNAQVFSKL